MSKKKCTSGQIVSMLREAEVLLEKYRWEYLPAGGQVTPPDYTVLSAAKHQRPFFRFRKPGHEAGITAPGTTAGGGSPTNPQ